jgi:hypothetical protein
MASKAVTVCCRFRPRVAKADLASGADAFIYDEHSVQAKERGSSFTFDHVFGPSKDQSYIFEEAAKPLVEAALNGINATIMCYGQVRIQPATFAGTRHAFMLEVYADGFRKDFHDDRWVAARALHTSV